MASDLVVSMRMRENEAILPFIDKVAEVYEEADFTEK